MSFNSLAEKPSTLTANCFLDTVFIGWLSLPACAHSPKMYTSLCIMANCKYYEKIAQPAEGLQASKLQSITWLWEDQVWPQLHTQGLSNPWHRFSLTHFWFKQVNGALEQSCSMCLCLQRHLSTHEPSATTYRKFWHLQFLATQGRVVVGGGML